MVRKTTEEKQIEEMQKLHAEIEEHETILQAMIEHKERLLNDHIERKERLLDEYIIRYEWAQVSDLIYWLDGWVDGYGNIEFKNKLNEWDEFIRSEIHAMDEFIKSKLPVMDEIIDGIDENLESAMNDLKELKQEMKK